MTGNYVQKCEVDLPKGARKFQIIGLCCVLGSLGFIVLAIVINMLFLIGFAILFIIGFVFLQIFGNNAKSYEYDFNGERLVAAKQNLFGRQKRISNIPFSSVTKLALFCDTVYPTDIIACSDTQSEGVYALHFNITADGTTNAGSVKDAYKGNRLTAGRILFMPDEYMLELIKDKIQNDLSR